MTTVINIQMEKWWLEFFLKETTALNVLKFVAHISHSEIFEWKKLTWSELFALKKVLYYLSDCDFIMAELKKKWQL